MSTDGAEPQRSSFPAAFASVMGWAFDLFDLFLLLYVAKAVGDQIFPADSETLRLALVFASFAVSIVMRPGGAAFFGELADRHGRRKIMVTVLAGVGLTTAAMGLVPTYSSVGVVAPISFLILRVVQGLFVGGVTATTHTLGTESVGPRWRGLMSGLIGAGGAGLGAAIASIAFIIVGAIYPGAAFDETGWRVMFFTGLIGAALSLFVLGKVDESPLWLEAQRRAVEAGARDATEKVRLADLISGRFRKILLVNVAVAAGGGAQYYLTSGFLPTTLDVVMDVPSGARGMILLISSLGVVIASILAGELSERIGRRPTMLGFGVLNLGALPAATLYLVSLAPTETTSILIGTFALAFLANAAYSPVLIFFNERFPTELRARGTAISWNTGFMFGGLLPTFVNLLSPEVSDVPGRLAVFLVISVLVFLVAVYVSPETLGALDRERSLGSRPQHRSDD